MKSLPSFRLARAALAGGALLIAAPALAEAPPPVRGGPIGTLPFGVWTCEMPGDASGPAGKPLSEFEFRVVNASSYKAGGIRGSYLFVGDTVTMTGGKLRGLRLHRLSATFLREIGADGSDGEMRCVLSGKR